ncbi:hypothetical protein ACFS6F_05210 [Halobacillus naozhouensis]|uniref:hypothetical protein n=1 Tax=Halobacillus naozhouensis TaxID=554880 RepID=UPI003627BB11
MSEKLIAKMIFILIAFLFLTACNSMYHQLGVEKEEPPEYEKNFREEGANSQLIFTQKTTEGSGETEAKLSLADTLVKLTEFYSITSIKVIDSNGEDWYAVYFKDEHGIRYIQNKEPEDLTREEKSALNYYKTLDSPSFPLLEYSKDEILDYKRE